MITEDIVSRKLKETSEDPYAQDIQGHRTKGQMLHGLVLWIQASPDMQ